jgi:hypothetical protein
MFIIQVSASIFNFASSWLYNQIRDFACSMEVFRIFITFKVVKNIAPRAVLEFAILFEQHISTRMLAFRGFFVVVN